MRNGFDPSDKSLRSLAQHVKDLRKLWYIEHENNRKLVNLIQNNSGTKSRSGRRSAMNGESLMNISGISAEWAGNKDCETGVVLADKLRYIAGKAVKSGFSLLTRRDKRPKVGRLIRKTLLSVRETRLKSALLAWRHNASLTTIVARVNTDLRFIRAFDRLDVWVRCKLSNSLKSAWTSLTPHTRKPNYPNCSLTALASAIRKLIVTRGFAHMSRPYQTFRSADRLITAITKPVSTLFFSKLRWIRTATIVLSRLSAIKTTFSSIHSARAFGFLCGIATNKKDISAASTSLASSARSSRDSPDRRKKTLILSHFAVAEIALRMKEVLKRSEKLGFVAIRGKTTLKFPSKTLKFALILIQTRNNRCGIALKAIQRKADYVRKCASVNLLISRLKTPQIRVNLDLLSIAWVRFNAFYEKSMEKRQGIEAFDTAFHALIRRKHICNAWERLKSNSKLDRIRTELFALRIGNVSKNRLFIGFFTILGELEREKGKIIGAFGLLEAVFRPAKRPMKDFFRYYREGRRDIAVAALWKWKYAKDARSVQIRLRISSLSRISYRCLLSSARILLKQWSKRPFSPKLITVGSNFLSKLVKKRCFSAFSLLKQHKDLIIAESNAICFVYSLNSVFATMRFATFSIGFEMLKKFEGFPMDKNRVLSAFPLLNAVFCMKKGRIVSGFYAILTAKRAKGRKRLEKVGEILSKKVIAVKSVAFLTISHMKERLCFPAYKLAYVFHRKLTDRLTSVLITLKHTQKPRKPTCSRSVLAAISRPVLLSLTAGFKSIHIYAVSHPHITQRYVGNSSGIYRHYSEVSSPSASPHSFSLSLKVGREGECRSPIFGRREGEGSRSPHKPLRMLTTSML